MLKYLNLLKSELFIKEENSFPLPSNFLKLILETSPEAIFVKDKAFRIVLANRAFLNFYPKEMRSKVIGYTTIESYQPDEVKKFLKYDKIAFEEGYSSMNERISFPNGDLLIIYTQKVRFEDESGEEFILGISQNITERQKLLEDLTKSNKSLLRVNGELEEFSYRASHDLKSPLLTTLGLVEVIKEDLDEKNFDEVHKNLDRIREHTLQLENLVNDILNLSQSEHSHEEFENFYLIKVLEDIELKLEGLFKSKEVKLKVEIDNDLEVYLGKVQLTQALENLISNAIKYSDEERESYIVVSGLKTDGNITITVEDNGVGIEKKYQDQVFSMFKRFHPNVATGSGLGLYLVKKHVESMKGEVTFESSDEGTCFTIGFTR